MEQLLNVLISEGFRQCFFLANVFAIFVCGILNLAKKFRQSENIPKSTYIIS